MKKINPTQVALKRIIEPIVRELLKAGIGYRELDTATKLAFIDIASKEHGVRGRTANIARVSSVTGLSRKEIPKLRGKEKARPEKTPTTAAADVLRKWRSDGAFMERNGEPRTLPFDGMSPTFKELVESVAVDVPPGAIRSTLLRIGAITETEKGVYKLARNELPNLRLLQQLEESISRSLGEGSR